jgi:signal transduction histidine kinase
MNFRAISKKLDLKLYFDPKLPKNFCTESQRLKQILINLLSNAIKYTFEGTVELKVE